MGKVITTAYINDTVNGIRINSSKPCNASNFNNNASRTVSYVVMHYTGNTSDTAQANANYFQGANREASAHFFVDDTNIYQSVELRDTAWHCGANTYYHNGCRNSNSIGIEMCTSGNYKVSDKTKTNAAYLCAHICKMLGITASSVDTYVLRHWDVTHKSCPAQMAGSNNAEWTAFKAKVKDILNNEKDSEDEMAIKYGQTNDAIHSYKQHLRVLQAMGVISTKVANDGGFGDGTLKATKELQKAAGITVDGIVGKDTINAVYTLETKAYNALKSKITNAKKALG